MTVHRGRAAETDARGTEQKTTSRPQNNTTRRKSKKVVCSYQCPRTWRTHGDAQQCASVAAGRARAVGGMIDNSNTEGDRGVGVCPKKPTLSPPTANPTKPAPIGVSSIPSEQMP